MLLIADQDSRLRGDLIRTHLYRGWHIRPPILFAACVGRISLTQFLERFHHQSTFRFADQNGVDGGWVNAASALQFGASLRLAAGIAAPEVLAHHPPRFEPLAYAERRVLGLLVALVEFSDCLEPRVIDEIMSVHHGPMLRPDKPCSRELLRSLPGTGDKQGPAAKAGGFALSSDRGAAGNKPPAQTRHRHYATRR